MSEPIAATPAGQTGSAPHATTQPTPLFPITRSWKLAAIGAIIMVLLALLGVAITTASRAAGPIYWIALVPVYAVLSIATTRARERHAGGEAHQVHIWRQIWHWLGIGVALVVDFLIRGTGEESGLGAGLNAMLLLAVGCYLAGVHFEWLFAVVGVLLTLALIILMKTDQYLWLIFVIGGLSILAVYGLPRLFERRHRKPMVASPSH
jgi:hypothetical protein